MDPEDFREGELKPSDEMLCYDICKVVDIFTEVFMRSELIQESFKPFLEDNNESEIVPKMEIRELTLEDEDDGMQLLQLEDVDDKSKDKSEKSTTSSTKVTTSAGSKETLASGSGSEETGSSSSSSSSSSSAVGKRQPHVEESLEIGEETGSSSAVGKRPHVEIDDDEAHWKLTRPHVEESLEIDDDEAPP